MGKANWTDPLSEITDSVTNKITRNYTFLFTASERTKTITLEIVVFY
jgi:hypothetical protein